MLLVAACSPKAEDTKVAAADSAATVPSDSSGMGDMAGMSTTGDPDRDFLRMMSDHHKGLIAMAHETMVKETGKAYATKSYQFIVVHHRRAIAMIDEYLPRAVRADVKDMAEAMRRDQLGEITDFERKAQAGGK